MANNDESFLVPTESMYNKQKQSPEVLCKKSVLKTDSNTGVFLCKFFYCKIFKSTCFEEHLQTASSM